MLIMKIAANGKDYDNVDEHAHEEKDNLLDDNTDIVIVFDDDTRLNNPDLGDH